MKINVSGSYIDISRLVKAGLDLEKDRLVDQIIRSMKKSKYDDSGRTWYFTLSDDDEIEEMYDVIRAHSVMGYSELALNFLRARFKEEAKTDDQ